MLAVDGETSTVTMQDRRHLIMHALIRMALGWGYLDARAALVPLGRSEPARHLPTWRRLQEPQDRVSPSIRAEFPREPLLADRHLPSDSNCA